MIKVHMYSLCMPYIHDCMYVCTQRYFIKLKERYFNAKILKPIHIQGL